MFGLRLCSAGIGGVRLILCSWYCGHSQFPTELHWLPVDGVQGFPVVRVFDKVEESVLRLLEVFIKTDSGWLVGKLQLYEPSTSYSMGRYNLSTSDLRWCILYMVRNFIVFVWSLVCSCNVQFMMLRQQVTTGTAKVLMASSLFAEFSSDLRLIIIIILFMVKKCPFGRHAPTTSLCPKLCRHNVCNPCKQAIYIRRRRPIFNIDGGMNYPRFLINFRHSLQKSFDSTEKSHSPFAHLHNASCLPHKILRKLYLQFMA